MPECKGGTHSYAERRILSYHSRIVKAPSGSFGQPAATRPPRLGISRGAAPSGKINSLIQRGLSPLSATSCQLGFARGIPGWFVGFSGSIVDSPGSIVDSSGSFAGFSAEMSRSMTITIAYGAYSGEDYDK